MSRIADSMRPPSLNYRNAAGTIEPVIYFENKRGRVIVAPDTRHPTPVGYERKECRTLAEVDALTRRVNSQDQAHFDDLMEKDRLIMQSKREKIKATLGQRLLAIDCSAIERSFIKGAFAYFDRKERESAKCVVRGYFSQREYDHPLDGLDPGKQLVMPKPSDRLAAILTKS